MNAELANYAAKALANQQIQQNQQHLPMSPALILMEHDVSIEDRMTSWDAGAARESMQFVGAALKEIGDEIKTIRPLSIRCSEVHPESDDDEDDEHDASAQGTLYDLDRRRQAWIRQQERFQQRQEMDDGPTEHTRLV